MYEVNVIEKGIKLEFTCMKMKPMKNKIYLQPKFSRKVLLPETTIDFLLRVIKSYVFFYMWIPYGYIFCADFS